MTNRMDNARRVIFGRGDNVGRSRGRGQSREIVIEDWTRIEWLSYPHLSMQWK